MGDNKRKQDLEEEMSRFEQEIAGNLPPPPKIPNIGPGPPPPWMQCSPVPPFHGERLSRLPFPGPPPPIPVFHPSPMDGNRTPMDSPMMVPPLGLHPSGFMPPPPMLIPPPVMMPLPAMVLPPQSTPVIPRPGEILPPTIPLHNFESTDGADLYAIPGTSSESANESKKKKDKKKTVIRVAGGQVWEDDSLLEWENNDFRIFVGDLGNEVSDDALLRAFSRYPSILKARVIRDKKTKKTKGFGFVSFKDPQDYLKAMREMNGKYVGNRPVKLRKSTWKDRNINVAKKKEKEKKKLGVR